MGIREAAKRGIAALVLAAVRRWPVVPARRPSSPRPRRTSRRATASCWRHAPYAQATIPEPYLRHIVDYHRKEAPGTIVVDPDARYLYYVLPSGKAIRYGVTVGEEALVFSGVAKVGRKEEWPSWTPTADIKKRLGNIPDSSARPAQSARRARPLSLHRQQGHAVPHPRHQPAGIHRLGDLLGLHPHDQRGRDRSLQPGQDRHARSWCWRRRRATRRSIRAWRWSANPAASN